MYCRSCLKQIRDDYKICPYCGRAQKQNKSGSDLPLGYSPRKNKIMVICIIVIILLTFLGTLAPNTIYELKLKRFNKVMASAAATAEVTCNIVRDVWRDSIYEIDQELTRPFTQLNGEFYDDFNDALDILDSSVLMDIQRDKISEHKKQADKLYKQLRNYPDKYFDHYECAGLMYRSFDLLVNLANSQENLSYNEYAEILEKSAEAFWAASAALMLYMK